MMKTAVMAIALLMGSLAFSQTITPEEKAYNLTVKMTQQLSLDADKASKIADINTGIAQKNDGVRHATNMTEEQKAQVIQSNYDARLWMYKGVLTADQYAKYEAAEKLRKETAGSEEEL